MNFNDLESSVQKELHEELLSYANSIGGINFFLQLIEDIKKAKGHPLLNKSSVFHYSKGKISWKKSIYKDTLDLLHETIRKEEKNPEYFSELKPKHQKATINMMKALKPVSLEIKPKDDVEEEGFSVSIIDTKDEENIKISLLYKVIFFYNTDFSKKVFAYTPEV